MNNSVNDLVSDRQDLLSLERQFCAARPVSEETVRCKLAAVCFFVSAMACARVMCREFSSLSQQQLE